MSMVIDHPDGQIMVDQNRRVKETTTGVSVTDSVTVVVPPTLMHLVDREENVRLKLSPSELVRLENRRTLLSVAERQLEIVISQGQWPVPDDEWKNLRYALTLIRDAESLLNADVAKGEV